MKIYLDACCLNRPFDDASQSRIAREADAVIEILRLVDAGRLMDYSSEMAQIELGRMKDVDRRRKVLSLLPPKQRIILLTDDLLDDSDKLIAKGFSLADAVHLAAAQKQEVKMFLTVDDKLLKRAARFSAELGLRVVDPVAFLKELEK